MRDLVVRQSLAAMAEESGERLRELTLAGEEIPYEVREPGDGSTPSGSPARRSRRAASLAPT
jgi:hypothetical protein